MNRQEFLDTLTSIGTCESEEERRTMLASLHNEASALYDTNQNLENERDSLTEANERLREANLDLFLQVGSREEPEDKKEEEVKEKRQFKDLFNEKGGLK